MKNRVELHFDLEADTKSADEARDLVQHFVRLLREFGVADVVAASWQTNQKDTEWVSVPL